MKKAITITIPKPCHENWDEMTPTEKGKFCGVCTKEVIDFSKSSDEELIKKIGNSKNLCGRFNAGQLDRKLTLERKSRNKLLPYAASLLLPLSLIGGTDTFAQSGPNVTKTHFTSLGIGSHSIDKSQVIISGFVTNEQGVPLNNTKITVEETGKSVYSNLDGSYRIVCTSGSTLAFTAPNMVIQKSKIGTAHAQLDIVFEADVQLSVLGGMVGLIVESEETIEGEIEIEEISPDEIEKLTDTYIEELKQAGVEVEEEKTVPEILENGKPIFELKDEIGKPTCIKKKSTEVKEITINGTITDENNLPLPGVNVVIKDSKTGTQTDFNGNYSIHIEANKTLVFHFLGYETKEIIASNVSNTIGFQMQPMVEGNVMIVVGGFYLDEEDTDVPAINNPFGYDFPRNDNEHKERIAKRRKAKANEVAFQKIKLEKKKIAKATKNLKRKRK